MAGPIAFNTVSYIGTGGNFLVFNYVFCHSIGKVLILFYSRFVCQDNIDFVLQAF